MKQLKDFMMSALARKGLAGQARSAQICFWADEWGRGRFTARSYSRGILKVSVSSSSAAQDLQMKEGKLVDYLNKRLGGTSIKSIRIVNRGTKAA